MKKIVVVGGGTGSFNVLKGLKQYPADITAIVTTFDNGGSTGILRDEFGTLPSGDIRRCLVALAPDMGDATLRDVFNYRFLEKSSLAGHSFGNLFLKALTEVAGSEIGAIKKAGELLNIKGRVLPVSIDDAHLCALLENGKVIRGETNIDIPKHDGSIRIKEVYLEPRPVIFGEAYSAITEADSIIICPGDLYTSILPNILVQGFTEALAKSKARLIYVPNIMTKWGETNDFKCSDFVGELLTYLGLKKLDFVVVNSEKLRPVLVKKYKAEKSEPVKHDFLQLKKQAGKVIVENIIHQSDIIRHDSKKLARILVQL